MPFRSHYSSDLPDPTSSIPAGDSNNHGDQGRVGTHNLGYRGDFWHEDEVQSVIRSRESALLPAVQDRIATLTELARRAGISVAAHDTATPDLIDRIADLGVTIAEYPTALSAAQQANHHGLTVAIGALNLVRGGSLWGNLSTRQAIDADSVDVLCSDFIRHLFYRRYSSKPVSRYSVESPV